MKHQLLLKEGNFLDNEFIIFPSPACGRGMSEGQGEGNLPSLPQRIIDQNIIPELPHLTVQDIPL